VWIDGFPLKVRFPKLFRICRQQDRSVREMFEEEWYFDFRRNLGEEDVAELIELESLIEEVDISESKDQLII